MLIEMLKKNFLTDDMVAFDRIKLLLCFKKYLLCILSRSRLVQTPLIFAIVL